MKSNKEIFAKIKEREFHDGADGILNILEEHLEKVKFVKSIVGLQNVLYVEELSIDIEDDPLFLSLDLRFDPENKHEAFSVLYEQAVSDPAEIQLRLRQFFEGQTDTTLYVEIGFAETVLSNDDMFEIKEYMETHKEMEPFEAINKFRRFPDWYDAKHAEDIFNQTRLWEQLRFLERQIAQQWMKDIKTEIDQCMDRDDMKKIKHLIRLYKNIQKHHI